VESSLWRIQDQVSKYVQMVTSVFNVHVDIADANKVRIAGTGRFNRKIGSPFGGRVFDRVVQTQRKVFIENPETNPICKNCHNLPTCKDQCELALPITIDQEIIGVIYIASSNLEQYQTITKNYDKMVLFMESVTDMIALRVREDRDQRLLLYHSELQKKLINLINDGVMLLDKDNDITYMNQHCERIFGYSVSQVPYLKKINQFKLIEHKIEKRGLTEIIVKVRDKRIQLLGKFHLIDGPDNEPHKVFIFTDVQSLQENINLSVAPEQFSFDFMIGESERFNRFVEICKEKAYLPDSVLLIGESGTEKEHIARAIHHESLRRNNQFIRINNGSAVEEIIEKSIFDAESDTYNQDSLESGNELLHGNTIYVDEVADLNPRYQSKLLAIIKTSAMFNCKVICSTSRDLRQMVLNGDFNQDLYFVLDINSVAIPPIRNRGKDSLLFATHYLNKYNASAQKNLNFSKDVREKMLAYSWEGNVKEIENVISYIVLNIPADTSEIRYTDLPLAIRHKFENDRKQQFSLGSAEKDMIIKALNSLGGPSRSKSAIAKELGISTATLYRKLKQYNITQNTRFDST
jgi:transcriptional regulator with PAS, ATPase and Fis domain